VSNVTEFLKVCCGEKLLFFTIMVIHSLVLDLFKKSYHGWLSMMTSSEASFSALPRALPTLNPPLHVRVTFGSTLKTIRSDHIVVKPTVLS